MPNQKSWWKDLSQWSKTMRLALITHLVVLNIAAFVCLSVANYIQSESWNYACNTTGQYVRQVAQGTAFHLHSAEGYLNTIRHTLETTGKLPPFDPAVGWRDGIRYVYYIDAAGRLSHDAQNSKDSYLKHFDVHRNKAVKGTYIGRAVWDAALLGWVVPLSMSVQKADGSFNGVIIALLDLSSYIREYDRIGAPPDAKISLVGKDRYVRVANTLSAAKIFSGTAIPENIFDKFSDDEEYAVFASHDENDTDTITAVNILSGRPLAVRVDIPRTTLLPDEGTVRRNVILIAFLVFLFIIASLVIILRALHQRHESRLALEKNRDDLQLMVDERTKELRDSNDKLMHLAYYDPDTDMPNRAALAEWLSEEMFDVSAGRRGSIIAVNLDEIHIIGSTFGRAICNEIIKQMAERLQAVAPEGSFCAHFGSNEFFLACPGVGDRAELAELLEKFRRTIHFEAEYEGITMFVTASLGGAIYPDDGSSPVEVIRSADSAMFAAKIQGKNHACIYTEEIHKAFYDDIALTHEMKKAIENSEFFLYYQPQVDAVTHKLMGYEALIRWPNPARGFVPPSRFIPLAEKNGLINPIGKWVFRTACNFIKRLAESGHPDVKVSINVSARQFARPDFLESVASIIKETGVNPNQIEVEVTESMLFDALGESVEKLAAIQSHSISIALDDFGTGYSSLSYLQDLPFDILKIDKSFVDRIPNGTKGVSLVKTIINLSQTLGKHTIAEGIETAEQLECLKDLGCDIIQGYYFSKPLPADDAIAFLERNQAETAGAARRQE